MFSLRVRHILYCFCVCLFLATNAIAESTFDRELVVKNKSRSAAVENVLRELIRAYENEDARGFLDLVNEDRFRQDYLTFTDALYNDFRTYEIHRVDFWVDRVQADNVKQFITVHWNKNFESLDSAKQFKTSGVSRFLFDEVNGKYLLIELAGNDLFGDSLPEWADETPAIPGQKIISVSSSVVVATPGATLASTSTPTPTPVLKADLIVVSANISTSGSMRAFTFVVKNQGSASSVLCSAEATHPAYGVIQLYNNSIPPLNPGATYTATTDASLWDFTPLTFTVDSSNTVVESNEGNNSFTITNSGVLH